MKRKRGKKSSPSFSSPFRSINWSSKNLLFVPLCAKVLLVLELLVEDVQVCYHVVEAEGLHNGEVRLGGSHYECRLQERGLGGQELGNLGHLLRILDQVGYFPVLDLLQEAILQEFCFVELPVLEDTPLLAEGPHVS